MAHLLTWLNTCKTCAFLLGGHMLHIGTWAYISPRFLVKDAGLRYDGRIHSANNSTNASATHSNQRKENDEGDQPENHWPLLFACREVAFGLLLLVEGGLGRWSAVGMNMLAVAGLLATTDGVVAGLYSKDGWSGAVKSHVVPAVVIGLMAIPLLRGSS